MARIVVIVLILLAPLSAVAAAVYEIVAGKNDPTLYLLLAVIPGALLAGLKELKESGLLPPERLKFEVNAGQAYIKRWERAVPGGDATQLVTDIVLPMRVENGDPSRAVDILDVAVTPTGAGIHLVVPEQREVKIGGETKWLFTLGDAGWEELFNDGRQKTVEAAKIKDYVIGLREYDSTHDRYPAQLSFIDNWKRHYSIDLTVDAALKK
jgi:hypothetical protein